MVASSGSIVCSRKSWILDVTAVFRHCRSTSGCLDQAACSKSCSARAKNTSALNLIMNKFIGKNFALFTFVEHSVAVRQTPLKVSLVPEHSSFGNRTTLNKLKTLPSAADEVKLSKSLLTDARVGALFIDNNNLIKARYRRDMVPECPPFRKVNTKLDH